MKICVFDTSCGCGNFLLVSYKELNLLLSKIASTAGKTDIPLMPIANFYGIESNPFSCAIARMDCCLSCCKVKSIFVHYQDEYRYPF
jgi:type I restriction-modification system DNA methylase subunit